MLMITSRGGKIEGVDMTAVERAFRALDDVGDFLILRDPVRGELRAAGRSDEPMLVQCDIRQQGTTFHGERTAVPGPEVLVLFRRFADGDTAWTSEFRTAGGRRAGWLGWLIVIVMVLALFLWIRFR